MGKRYNRKDQYYLKAKEEGYKSRAAYKLQELQKRYSLIEPGMKILDLGCWPGGWLQVASECLKGKGLVVGIDLVETQFPNSKNVTTIVGNANSWEVIEKAISFSGDLFDLILSDMSPKLTGIKEVDEAGVISCIDNALYASQGVLKEHGSLVMKVFRGSEVDTKFKLIRKYFETVHRTNLNSSRTSSDELYAVCLNFRRGTNR